MPGDVRLPGRQEQEYKPPPFAETKMYASSNLLFPGYFIVISTTHTVRFHTFPPVTPILFQNKSQIMLPFSRKPHQTLLHVVKKTTILLKAMSAY